MKQTLVFFFIIIQAIVFYSCNPSASTNEDANTNVAADEKELTDFINKIKAVDNHAHPNSIEPEDKGSDALPLDGLGNIELPVRVRPESPVWPEAAGKVYGFSVTTWNEKSRKDLEDTALQVLKRKGVEFP